MTFDEIVKFHGHRCPGLAMGYRMSNAALEVLGSLRSEDEELVAIVENNACGVDALQYMTGCTFGKGNLVFHDYGKRVYTVYSRSLGKGVRVLFHGRGIPEHVRADREALIEHILSAPEDDIISTAPVRINEPEPASILASVPCHFCGEDVMETRIQLLDGKPACIPCCRKLQKQEPDPDR